MLTKHSFVVRSVASLNRIATCVWGDTRGTIAMPFALMLIGILAAVGMGIDYSRANNAQTSLQVAVDAAVLAAARAETGAQIDTGKKFFAENFANDIVSDVSVNFEVTGRRVVKGTATGTVDATITALMGKKIIPVSAYAATGLLAYGDVCVLVLDETASSAFQVNSKTTVLAPECEIHVRSTANPAAKFSNGSFIESSRICIKGTKISDNGGKHDNVELGCAAASNPYVGAFTVPDTSKCDYNGTNYKGGVVNLKPGVYCGNFNFNSEPTVKFAAGTYVIKDGGWNVSGGTWTGNDVTFYFPDSSNIEFNSGVSATLQAPTTGTYAGVLIFEADGLSKSNFAWNDTVSAGTTLSGLIYLPSRDVTFNSQSATDGHELTLVVNTLTFNDVDMDLGTSDRKITVVTKSPTAVEGEVYIAE